MKAFARILIAAASSCALNAHAACELPLPTAVRLLPDGAAATEQELIAIRAEITAYVEVADAYIACIDEERAVAEKEAASPEFKAILVNRRNAAQTEKETVAAAFNRQLQAFRAAHPPAGQAGAESSSAATPRAESQPRPQ